MNRRFLIQRLFVQKKDWVVVVDVVDSLVTFLLVVTLETRNDLGVLP